MVSERSGIKEDREKRREEVTFLFLLVRPFQDITTLCSENFRRDSVGRTTLGLTNHKDKRGIS